MTAPAGWRNRIIGEGVERPDELLANPRNWRIHPLAQQAALGAVLEEVGWVQRIIVNKRTGYVVDGHARVELALSNNEQEIPVVYVDLSEEEERLILASLDPLAGMATTDAAKLAELLGEITIPDAGLSSVLRSAAGSRPPSDDGPARPSLSDLFGVPPFSVLDTRQGYWQDRRRQWLALGIQSEIGRGDGGEVFDSESSRPSYYSRKREVEAVIGRELTNAEFERDYPAPPGSRSGWSIFDPVLCELVYRWFAPPGGAVLDPFAGGSVRGIVAGTLGLDYVGVDLSERQVAANRIQAAEILGGEAVSAPPVDSGSGMTPVEWHGGFPVKRDDLFAIAGVRGGKARSCDAPAPAASGRFPRWIAGDSVGIAELAPGAYDLVFTCPPYADLEVYSDDPRDLSRMPFEAFLDAYRRIIAGAVGMLRDDRFACVVIGDVRDRRGIYRNLVSLTIAAFEDAGARLYNEAVLINSVGSMAVRVRRQFEGPRKLGKVHQNVLVFAKGDPELAAAVAGFGESGRFVDTHEGVLVFVKGDPRAAADALGAVDAGVVLSPADLERA